MPQLWDRVRNHLNARHSCLRSLSYVALAASLVTACNSIPEVTEGKRQIAEGQKQEGLAKLAKADRDNPQNVFARTAFVTQREALVGAYLRDGDALRIAGDLDAAEARYRGALAIDSTSALAQAGVDAVARDRRLAVKARDAEEALKGGDFGAAEQHARAVLAENSSHRTARAVMKAIAERNAQAGVAEPTLKADLQRQITVEFRDAPLQSVFEVISRTTGINFIFDRDVRPDLRTTIYARNTNIDDVIKLLLLTNQLTRKMLNDNSILIYPNTPPKQREYQELVVRSFYLANADAKQTASMIRALVKTRDLFIDEKLNLIVMKDTRDAVRLAEHLVATQDLGDPEVMLELEVLEVASTVVQEFGLRYPDQINFGVLGEGGATPPGIIELWPSDLKAFTVNPLFILNLRKLDGTASLLANPRIRVKNRDKARVHIGEKVPVITTTSTANVGVSSSVSYLETGLKLDVEPNVFLEDEVAIKVQLEVSNILEQLNVQGTVAYRLGTRNAATTLRLKDGETQVLAGLINSDDRRAAAKVPYLGDFPILGRLFRSDNDQRARTEIVLLITPRIVRNLARPDTVSAQLSSGTEASPGSQPLRLAATPSGALSIPPGKSVTAKPGAPTPADPARPAAAISLNVNAPPHATIGQEFSMTLALPAGSPGVAATVELTYDPNVLNVISGDRPSAPGATPPADPGRTQVEIVASGIAGMPTTAAQVRFRVVAKAPTSVPIAINVSAVDDAGRGIRVSAPRTHDLEIVAARTATDQKK